MSTLMIASIIFAGIIISAIIVSACINSSYCKYREDIIFYESAVKNFVVNYQNYLFLKGEMDRIMRRNLDKKRTKRAHEKFMKKYIYYINEELTWKLK